MFLVLDTASTGKTKVLEEKIQPIVTTDGLSILLSIIDNYAANALTRQVELAMKKSKFTKNAIIICMHSIATKKEVIDIRVFQACKSNIKPFASNNEYPAPNKKPSSSNEDLFILNAKPFTSNIESFVPTEKLLASINRLYILFKKSSALNKNPSALNAEPLASNAKLFASNAKLFASIKKLLVLTKKLLALIDRLFTASEKLLASNENFSASNNKLLIPNNNNGLVGKSKLLGITLLLYKVYHQAWSCLYSGKNWRYQMHKFSFVTWMLIIAGIINNYPKTNAQRFVQFADFFHCQCNGKLFDKKKLDKYDMCYK